MPQKCLPPSYSFYGKNRADKRVLGRVKEISFIDILGCGFEPFDSPFVFNFLYRFSLSQFCTLHKDMLVLSWFELPNRVILVSGIDAVHIKCNPLFDDHASPFHLNPLQFVHNTLDFQRVRYPQYTDQTRPLPFLHWTLQFFFDIQYD